MTCLVGAASYLTLVDEGGGWGDFPGASGTGAGATYYHTPVTSYNVRFRPENRQSNTYTGNFQRKHSSNFRGMPSGQLVTPLFGWLPTNVPTGGLAKKMLEWGFGDHEYPHAANPNSKSAEWYVGPNVANMRHTGLRVNQATLVGSDDAGALELTLDLMGAQEFGAPSAQTLPTDREKAVDFEFVDCTFQLAGVAVYAKSFTWTVQRALQAHYLNSDTPRVLCGTDRIETFQITLQKESNTYDVYRRLLAMTEMTGQMVLKGLHNGTGGGGTNYTIATVDFPRLSLIDVDEQGGRNDVLFQPLNFVCLKPDSSSNNSTITYSEA